MSDPIRPPAPGEAPSDAAAGVVPAEQVNVGALQDPADVAAAGLAAPGGTITDAAVPAVVVKTRRALVRAARHRSPAEKLESARSDGRTSQSSLLVMPRIRTGAMDSLLDLLKRIAKPEDSDIEINAILPFAKLRTVHFLRILVHQPSPTPREPLPGYHGKPLVHGDPIPAKLLFSTDFDGPLDEHIDELLDVAGEGLDRVFGHCEGWPGHKDRGGAHGFFLLHRVPSNTFYTGTMHRSVDQIHREAELRDRIGDFLDAEKDRPGFPARPVEIRQRILDFVKGDPELVWTEIEPGPFPSLLLGGDLKKVALAVAMPALALIVFGLTRIMPLWPAAILTLLAGLAAVGVVLAAAWMYLLRLEKSDPAIVGGDVKDHTRDLVQTEDRIVQNEMSSVIYIKEPLWFRGTLLKAVLAFINFSAKYLSNQGTLAGIPSIHFARWVVVDGGRRLVFFSNFDGSWDNYLGDFIDKAHTGLTGVWSNCVGFPRTHGLVGGGATNEQQFKAYSRDSQIPTQVWYSAYRWLSVSNINNNSKIRLGLYGEMGDADAAAWLRRFADGSQSATEPRFPDAVPVQSPKIEVADVQGLVARSYKPLAQAFYVPVTFTGGADGARRWVGGLASRVTAASVATKALKERAINVAFTYDGVQALGLDQTTLGTFSREFREGMAEEHRQRVLGDTGPAAPDQWRWGRPGSGLHAMLFLFASTVDELAKLLDDEKQQASACGVSLAQPLDSIMLAGDREHFGFHDGIAQPRVDGLKTDSDSPGEARIPAGEVVLGYPNAYGQQPATPSVPVTEAARKLFPVAPPDPYDSTLPERLDLGRNGSYVVFRQLEQNVKAFWEFLDRQAGGDAGRRKFLGAKMVGRWPNGAPLMEAPEQEPPEFKAETGNSFLYRGDLHGDRCPLGSHIRRSNPRDGMGPTPAESLLVADRHRLLRRGRAYGPPLAESFDPGDILAARDEGERGLHFICFNTDLGRQFEFVQNTWANSMKFDGLYADPDPVIGPHADPDAESTHPEEISSFTIQGCPVRHRVNKIPRFVTMRGGAYLFMPGIKALRYLSDPS